MIHNSEYWSRAFISKHHKKIVGGAKMLSYLKKILESYGETQYNSGYQKGYREGKAKGKQEQKGKSKLAAKAIYIERGWSSTTLCQEFGMNMSTFTFRIKQGWLLKDALLVYPGTKYVKRND